MNNIPIGFRLVGIHITEKNMAPMPQPFSLATVFNFNITVETRVQKENKLVMPFVKVIITEVDKSPELATIIVACLFDVVDFENVIKLDEKNVFQIPPELESMIRPVSISTTRGIIYSELRGTYLNNAIMPVVMMDAFTVPKTEDVTKISEQSE